MENHKKICSSKSHDNSEAISYCQLCRVYICEKCKNIHSELYDHPLIDLKNGPKDNISGFCEEENHNMKLDFYCKNHNILCCAACISKLKLKGNGQHSDCEICIIDDIKEEKKKNLHDNIKILEEMKDTIEQSINEMKKLIGKINENKDIAKAKIKEIFTMLKEAINDRENTLLNEVDNKMGDIFFDEKFIKKSEDLPKNIKISLEKAKLIDKNWDENKALSSIKECVSLENNINMIKDIRKKLDRSRTYIMSMSFFPDEKGINEFINNIKNFGDILTNNFRFQEYQSNLKDDNKYEVTGDLKNIITKKGKAQKWICALCSNKFEERKEYTWKIKIRNTRNFQIMVGVAPLSMNTQNFATRLGLPIQNQYSWNSWNFNTNANNSWGNYNIQGNSNKNKNNNNNYALNNTWQNSWSFGVNQKYINCGWYFYCFNSRLYSDKPHSFKGKETTIKKVRDEIKIIMNMENRSLKFMVNDENLGESYTDIPMDKPLTPAILLYDEDDSVEIITFK